MIFSTTTWSYVAVCTFFDSLDSALHIWSLDHRPSHSRYREIKFRNSRNFVIFPPPLFLEFFWVSGSFDLTSRYSRIFRELSLKPAPTTYILTELRHIASLRAKLRLNRNKLNYNLFRRKLHLPFCPTCPDTNEAAHHVLFTCPIFDAARRICFNTLDAYDCPVNFEVLTGDVSSIPLVTVLLLLRHLPNSSEQLTCIVLFKFPDC